MSPPVRAVAEGALVMAATLVVLMLGVVMISSMSTGTLLTERFFWGYALAGGLVLALGAAAAGGLAARRLPSGSARTLPALAGPLSVVSLVAVPSLFGKDWGAGVLYLVVTLVGSVAGVFGSARFTTRGGRS
ncbi:hypothetical protein ABZ801_27990 [Actinomadura sp. NPDC047616]|uniref:hypothetical protein n=1 Tax=Actinomadura sp. NPDC047616 TaxID=3155914 RepID=UPI0033C63A4F